MLQNDSIDCLIAYMKEHQKALGLTVHEYAQLANVPDNTINNIYYKKVDSVKIDIAARLVHAVNGSLDEVFGIGSAVNGGNANQNVTTVQIQQPTPPPASCDVDKLVDGIRAAHLREVEALQISHEHEMKTLVEAHQSESILRDKYLADMRIGRNLWCGLACGLMLILCGWLMWEVAHPAAGLLRVAPAAGLFSLFG